MNCWQEAFYRGVLWIQRDRGYKDGFAKACYLERYGMWPDNPYYLAPEPPNKTTVEWVRKNVKQYAKKKARSDRRKELKAGAPRRPASDHGRAMQHMKAIKREGTEA